MVDLFMIISLLSISFSSEALFAETLFSTVNRRFEFLTILITLGFIFFLLIFILIYHIVKLKRVNTFRLYLNLENMWNSPAMLEAREKAPTLITDELLNSQDETDKDSVRYAGVIADFFNNIGSQAYQGIIDFTCVYNLFGPQIIDYWENRNYKLLNNSRAERYSYAHIRPFTGFEHLSDISRNQRKYLAWEYKGRNIEPLIYRNRISNVPLFVFSFTAFISLIVFFISYLFYHGYV